MSETCETAEDVDKGVTSAEELVEIDTEAVEAAEEVRVSS
jgi:hypothetical protein